MLEKLLSVQHLSKQFSTHPVIDDLSFEMDWGERVALFAPSGSGKTTLINILSGLELYDSGSFTLQDRTPVTIFQESRLFPFLTVEENIFLPFKVSRKPVAAADQYRYQRWLEICQLSQVVHQYPYQLSGGMKQKVALIRGLLGEPQFVMMDEPFQSIDRASKKAIMAHILSTYPDTAFLFVTHNADEIPMFARSVLYFQAPRLTQAAMIGVEIFQTLQSNMTFIVNQRTEMCAAHYP